jgi:hypothetical protein
MNRLVYCSVFCHQIEFLDTSIIIHGIPRYVKCNRFPVIIIVVVIVIVVRYLPVQ